MSDNYRYGIRSIFCKKSRLGICKDIVCPSIISVSITSCVWFMDIDMFPLLVRIWDISMTVIPIIITLLVTAYTILITVISGLKEIAKGNTKGGDLLTGLNNSFASSIILSIIFLGVLFVYFIIGKMGIEHEYANLINAGGLFTTIIFIIYPFVSLINIVIDIFNSEKLQLYIWSVDPNTEQTNNEDIKCQRAMAHEGSVPKDRNEKSNNIRNI